MIELRNVSKSFGEKAVLEDISVKFERGKTNIIIGQSGSGKTVLLKSIVGLYEIDRGEIVYDKIIFSGLNTIEKREIRKKIGMLFQGGALFDSINVEENVMFPLDMFSELSLEEKRERANICLKRVNLENANKLFPAELSGGMKKRVAIARAIALNPQYLFCDEPNSGLDPKTSIVIDNLIKEITVEFAITTLVNTHDMKSVMEIGDKVVFIHHGTKAWEGTKDD
ncbi:MAG TPA: ATP-binding cassette domain-containing protein, partial [Bacteroidales bacterium]|nr:ATP-binding cassette domain-containing protein [Bacteroidales bacterium]